MNSRERLLNTMRGEEVDRPAVSFYEISGYSHDPEDKNPFNIYSHPSWQPLLDMAREETDCMVGVHPGILNEPSSALDELTKREEWIDENSSRFWRNTVNIDGREFTQLSRRDPDVDTIWVLEHFLKDADDLRVWLSVPPREFAGEVDVQPVLDLEKKIGDDGIVMIDTGDPLCSVAPLFSMEDYTILGLTEPELMHRALEHEAKYLHARTEAVASALPGRLWRIYGPEYASPPYLPPHLFKEYVNGYTGQMVTSIQKHGGFARIHSHGNLKDILDHIVAMKPSGLDPIEPEPQGNVTLKYVRENYGQEMVLFGNLEASDIENLPPDQMRQKVLTALEEGTSGTGRGFVLMPSASPYGRVLADKSLRNYEVILETLREFCR